MRASAQGGVLVTIFASLISTFQMVFGKVVKDLDWPYFRLSIASNTLMVLAYGAVIAARGTPLPEPSKRKWVLLRALFSTCTFLSSVVAVQVSGAPGDVSALTSINIVFAASFGHLFLSEGLRAVHVVIVGCSVAGAVLVARPSFLFGADDDRPGNSWIGYVLAMASGLLRACALVCARKSSGVAVSVVAFATAVVSLPLFLALPTSGLLADGSFDVVLAQPAAAAGLAFVIFSSTIIAITASTAGAMMCPAAISATVFTGSGMVFGYLAQMLLFGAAPSVVTLTGAGLMFAAVAAMANTRVPQQPLLAAAAAAAAEDTVEDDGVGSSAPSVTDTEDETESITLFAASEFAAEEPHIEAVRLRRPVAEPAGGKPEAQRVGVSSMTSVVVAAV